METKSRICVSVIFGRSVLEGCVEECWMLHHLGVPASLPESHLRSAHLLDDWIPLLYHQDGLKLSQSIIMEMSGAGQLSPAGLRPGFGGSCLKQRPAAKFSRYKGTSVFKYSCTTVTWFFMASIMYFCSPASVVDNRSTSRRTQHYLQRRSKPLLSKLYHILTCRLIVHTLEGSNNFSVNCLDVSYICMKTEE